MLEEFGAEKLHLVAVNMYPNYTTLAQWRAYLEDELGVQGALVAQDTIGLTRRLGIRNSASTLVLNRQGEEVFRDGVPTTVKDLRRAVALALQ